jgi:diazepam-binding inhibitor (GABA receptor modulating acyl-CoA-binding protein)
MESTDIIDKKFIYACSQVNRLREKPNDTELLALYGYYKQSLCGDNTSQKPNILNIKERKKWISWNNVKGVTTDQAKVEYYDLVNKLISKYGTRALV